MILRTTLAALAALSLAACESAQDEAAEERADVIEESTENQADTLEEMAGETDNEGTETALNEQADAVEPQGDAAADEIEQEAGEAN